MVVLFQPGQGAASFSCRATQQLPDGLHSRTIGMCSVRRALLRSRALWLRRAYVDAMAQPTEQVVAQWRVHTRASWRSCPDS
jgi:hypothetical protein